MAFSGSIEARLAVRELYGTYSDAAMRQDRVQYLSCWAEDGARISKDSQVRGKSAIAAQWDQIWATISQMGFFTEIASIEVDGDTASAAVYCRETVKFVDGRIWKLIGRYDDVLTKQGSQWCFKQRTYTIVLDEGMPQ